MPRLAVVWPVSQQPSIVDAAHRGRAAAIHQQDGQGVNKQDLNKQGLKKQGLKKIVYWVPHTHWDREWYRSFQSFRAMLVDTVDAVLDQLQADSAFTFLLDGQTVVLEDYLEIRPERATQLCQAVEERRLAIGPWYVQPDSLLPGGEAHMRNLLIGRQVGETIGPVAKIAYTPDSFGHPAQFPQLFAGFGLQAFVYWRGNGAEFDQLPTEYCWRAPDGSETTACLLYRGYFNGAFLPSDREKAIDVLKIVYLEASEQTAQPGVLIMNGVDHSPPHPTATTLAKGLADALQIQVKVGLLDDFVASIKGPLPIFEGALIGARLANLLPGVWSARLPLKLANRRAETRLQTLAEPMAVLGRVYGLADERAALRTAWKALLKNQAHDSIGGCSIDVVHRQMMPRFEAAQSLADETARRIMERLAGQDIARQTPLGEPFEIAVFNPSPYVRSGVARLALDANPAFISAPDGVIFHPVLSANKPQAGYTANGKSVRLVPGNSDGRFFADEHINAVDLEIPVHNVPAFGYQRIVLQSASHAQETIDDGCDIGNTHVCVKLEEGGTITLQVQGREYTGLMAVEDLADRGDSYDADIIADATPPELLRCKHRRLRHANGTQVLEVERLYRLARELTEERNARGTEQTAVRLFSDYILYPNSDELRVRVRLKNTAKDHRLRLLFPLGQDVASYAYATTFDVVAGRGDKPDDNNWLHPAPATFVHQGWISCNGLSVVAPGLPEAEITDAGTLAITLVRSVGWLSRHDLHSRPGPAGPVIPVDEAQCLHTIEAELVLFGGCDARKAQQCEIPLEAVFAADQVLMPPDCSMLHLHSEALLLSAFKPAETGQGCIVRLLNPTSSQATGEIELGWDVHSVQHVSLDERTVLADVPLLDAHRFTVTLAPHKLHTLRLQWAEE
jgi:mannosylglycerate hydrolase